MSDASDPNDPYWTAGPGKLLARIVVGIILGAMAALIGLHIAFGWPA